MLVVTLVAVTLVAVTQDKVLKAIHKTVTIMSPC